MIIPVAEPFLGKEELAAVSEAVRSGWISSRGRFTTDFEEAFARYCGCRYGVAVSNGTVALHLALKCLGIGPGDEVIVPTLTFLATVNAVSYTGAKPVLVDCDPEYWCIDVENMKKAVTKKTAAVIPVHLYGHPCDMDPILNTARSCGLFVVEDAAEAHGAEYKGKRVGSFGDISCFSFYGNKIITTGEGGMCLTDDKKLASKMRILRDHGMDPKKRFIFNDIGFNYRMTNMQAALGAAQIKKIGGFLKRKREIASVYDRLFERLAESGAITLPPRMPWARSVFWMYSLLIEERFGLQRDTVIKRLAALGIESRPVFYPAHIMKPYKSLRRFPASDGISRKGISLPSSAKLDNRKVCYVADSLKGLAR